MATNGARTRNQLTSWLKAAMTPFKAGINEWGFKSVSMSSTRFASRTVWGSLDDDTIRWTTLGMKLAKPLMAPVLPRGPRVVKSGSYPTYTVRGGIKALAKLTECA